jgi:hypothetical protein
LGQPFFEEVNTELDVEVFLLEVINVLLTVKEHVF